MSTEPTTYTVTQQALNVIRQLLNAKGWPETLAESYDGGKLVSKYLPELDPIDWIKTEAEVKTFTPDEAKAYVAKDKAWTDKACALSLSPKQVALVHKAFLHFVGELIKRKELGVSTVFNEIIDVFGIDPEKAFATPPVA